MRRHTQQQTIRQELERVLERSVSELNRDALAHPPKLGVEPPLLNPGTPAGPAVEIPDHVIPFGATLPARNCAEDSTDGYTLAAAA